MKTKKLFAALTALTCCAAAGAMPAAAADSGNRDQVYESSLILDADTATVCTTLRAFLWDSETNTKRIPAYTVRTQEGKICVVCDNDDVLETVKAFVAEAGFTAAQNALIEYRVESLENEGLTGGAPEPAQTQPIDSALILDDDTAAVWTTLSAFLWDSEKLTRRIPAYTVRTQEGKICVVCDNDEVLETVKAFVAEAGFTDAQNALIEYRVESLENELTDGDIIPPAEHADAPAAITLLGDVNAEGNVTVSDAILLARIVAEDTSVSVTQQGMKNADMNANGAPDQDDIVLLLRQIAGIK